MPRADSRYDVLRERYSDILHDAEDDLALTDLIDDLDAYMNVPVPANQQQIIDRAVMPAVMAEATEAPETTAHNQPQLRHASRARQRIGVWMSAAAAVLIVALLAATLMTRFAGVTGQTTSGNGVFSPPQGVCAPGDITARLPANGEISSIAMVSPNEGWALGGVMDPTTFEPVKSLMLHYAHCTWTPVPANYPNAGLGSLSMGSATDGWAIGSTSSGAPVALHYTNGAWQHVPAPSASVLRGGAYTSVHMLSADEGWIIFNNVKDSHGYLTEGLLHLVNGQWSAVSTPFPNITDVLPVAPQDAWFVGSIQGIPLLYHYQAGTWTRVTVPSGVEIYTLRMVSPNNIWASGQVDLQQNGYATGAVMHYDGRQWQQVPVSANGNPQDVEAFDQNTSWAFTKDNGGFLRNPVITGAQYEHDGSWQSVAWPFTNLSRIGSLIRVSADEYWAIGYYDVENWTPTGNGVYSGSGHEVSVLLYFANGAWHQIPTR